VAAACLTHHLRLHLRMDASVHILPPAKSEAEPSPSAHITQAFSTPRMHCRYPDSVLSFCLLPCPAVANTPSVTIRATYAEGSSMFFKTNTISIPVGTSCYNTTCANGGGAPPPPPPTPPPPPPPTTNPNAPPVYPQCINAPLLANPCPLGKRCFYDTQCKPQMEDMSKLLSPNCENAVPLKNPWPAGKCCFYDSQVCRARQAWCVSFSADLCCWFCVPCSQDGYAMKPEVRKEQRQKCRDCPLQSLVGP
jgi:hypothetical protein